ncbi:MAG: hypothetical protein COA96_04725 [SAR86 cluster bacterium]|uniref:DUF1631 domain-containing protein n=1 Tax=SAR86 cluster bacterium TaxID=2030880 RepID=A0A2A5B4Y4_9GAMM|nr:MAG: hypothetical protein COA96_04725 [SAR86 cluster bacterium]
MDQVKEIVNSVKEAMLVCLSDSVSEALREANMVIANQPGANSANAMHLNDEKQAVVERFSNNIGSNFDELTGSKSRQVNVLDYGSLSLVEEDDLEAIIAMEGMISHARNCDIQEYLRFTTRLDSLFYGTRIDESNNPMDPEQIGEAFRDAIRPVSLTAPDLLIAYRKFNSCVFHNLENALEKANGILIQKGIIPNLDIAARNKKEQRNKRRVRRQKSDPTDRAFATAEQNATGAGTNQQLLSMMQNLMHGSQTHGVPAQTVPTGNVSSNAGHAGLQQGMMIGSQKVEIVASDQLLSLLNKLQSVAGPEHDDSGVNDGATALNLSNSVGKLLEQGSDSEVLRAIDSQSLDIINLVTFLYEEIWRDETVPIPVKELIGRTQITILKLALQDASFFEDADHPARILLNELATAGICWTETDKQNADPMYRKMNEIVNSFVKDFSNDLELIENLIDEFKEFKHGQALASQESEHRLMDADERKNRLSDVNDYALHKIKERILSEDVHSFVQNFLLTHFHKFVVQVVLREGPGGISWKPVMNTIDVLLWTVSHEKSEGDLEKFTKVNPRLLANLGKALEVAGIEKDEAEQSLNELKNVQEECFKGSWEETNTPSATPSDDNDDSSIRETPAAESKLPEDDEHLLEVAKYPIGIWLEFQVDSEHTIRCTLAAKIDTIEKYVFVNGQGVKVVEKSKTGLARELKAGTVKVISEAPLIDRAMESVIGKLRESTTTPQ